MSRSLNVPKTPKKRPNPMGCSWCFTINNYTNDDTKRLQILSDDCKYMVLGFEIGEALTEHIQGYVQFKHNKRFKAVKALLGRRCHLEKAGGTPLQASSYCKKDGKYWENGIVPKGKGFRADLSAVVATIKNDGLQERDLALLHPCVYIKYHSGLAKLSAHAASLRAELKMNQSVVGLSLRPWQKVCVDKYHQYFLSDNDRKIMWVVDAMGNAGKSTLARYMTVHYNAQKLGASGYRDLARAYDVSKNLVIIDIPKSSEHVPYGFIEHVRDGSVFSGKYDSGMKSKVPGRNTLIIVFSNIEPDRSKFSVDRWDVIYTDDYSQEDAKAIESFPVGLDALMAQIPSDDEKDSGLPIGLFEVEAVDMSQPDSGDDTEDEIPLNLTIPVLKRSRPLHNSDFYSDDDEPDFVCHEDMLEENYLALT